MCSSIGTISFYYIVQRGDDLQGLAKIGKQWYLTGYVLEYFLIWPGKMLKLYLERSDILSQFIIHRLLHYYLENVSIV